MIVMFHQQTVICFQVRITPQNMSTAGLLAVYHISQAANAERPDLTTATRVRHLFQLRGPWRTDCGVRSGLWLTQLVEAQRQSCWILNALPLPATQNTSVGLLLCCGQEENFLSY